MKEKLGNVILDFRFYTGEDQYSDGEEDELLKICESETDLMEVVKRNNSWAILYHFCNIRENLLEWYNFNSNGTLLEIGAGCGALSGLFCRKVKSVTAIELSKKRSLINATRNKNYSNLYIMIGNLENMEIAQKYDYVTLIGVLEYAISYIHGENPFVKLLEKARNYLKKDGKLFLAIENKYGLKYWAGAMEDHTGMAYDGINGYKNIDRIRTFSKDELEQLLLESGFTKNEFYYPIPDYKLPSVVYSQKYLPQFGDLRGTSVVYDRDRYQMFEEDRVFDNLCNEKKFEEYANSFLVISSME